jgi:redox-sensitive bicupin YhaK (pirin superfamily)
MSRSVASVVTAHQQMEGGGFPVRRPFPTAGLDQVDPFLLLDEMGPVEWPPEEAIGAPDHPHRGFETVTYLLEGHMCHRDSFGHAGELRAGDVQWMTAGSGLVHSEMPHPDFQKNGGTTHGFQLWVNLPRNRKLMAPRYQEITAAEIPLAESNNGLVQALVIAGESLGVSASIETVIPITYLHLTIAPGGALEQPLTPELNAMVYCFGGAGEFGPHRTPATDGQLVLFGDGETVDLCVPDSAFESLEALLLAGAPLSEPVARYGPFVMNSHNELAQAVEDFQAGKMGRIAPAE